MKRLFNWAIGIPLAVIIIAIAVANRSSVSFSLDPFSSSQPYFSIDAPLYMLLLGAGFIGLLFGGVTSWLSQGKWRRAAREARSESSRLRNDVDTLKRRATSTPEALPPPSSNQSLS